MPLAPGAPAPFFTARSDVNPTFTFHSLGGFYVLLAFTPDDPDERERMLALLEENQSLFVFGERGALTILGDEAAFLAQPTGRGAMRYLHDPVGDIARLYRMTDGDGRPISQWVVLDPALRILASLPGAAGAQVFDLLRKLPPPEAHAGVPLTAPVLVVPRIFEPALCRELIDHYHAVGGEISGVMKDIGGRTVGVVDSQKKRRDAFIHDEALKARLRACIATRLLPEIEKAFMFKVTRMERYIVARYDAEEGGYFRPHRDNTTMGTAHRQFACSINLNAEEFEGGDLRFPEFGRRTYRPPTGGAVVFSCALLHEATPVTRGSRYAFLPFFYDDAAAKVRDATRPLLVNAGGPAEPQSSEG